MPHNAWHTADLHCVDSCFMAQVNALPHPTANDQLITDGPACSFLGFFPTHSPDLNGTCH